MPWKECKPMDERLRFIARLLSAKKWSIPVRDWKGALNRFMIEFPERMLATL